MKLAIITCSQLPEGVADDQDLFEALRLIGIDIEIIAWDATVDWSNYDAGLIRSVWDYHERINEFTSWLEIKSREMEIINSPDIILWNRNKLYLNELSEFGIPIAPTQWIQKNNQKKLTELVRSHAAEQFFLKPVVGADSAGTMVFNNNQVEINQAQQHLDKWLPQVDMMLQPYLKSVETFGETSLIYFAGKYSHGVRKIPQNGDYRVQDTFGATDISYKPNGLEFSLSKACLQFLAQRSMFPLYARFDYLQDHDGSTYLNEAEMIEPSLFFNHGPKSAHYFAEQIKYYLNNQSSQ